MIINTFSNRGKPLEDYLKLVHERYRHYGKGCLTKVPTEFLPIRDHRGQVVNCKVEEKAVVDFLGRYGSIPVAVEAKHEEGRRIAFSRVEPHQKEFMDDWCRAKGSEGIVIVSFGMRRFFAVPWFFWEAGMKAWKEYRGTKLMVRNYGWKWETPGMASTSPEQLHPEWEIKEGGHYVLPYLNIINLMHRPT